MGQKTNPIGNRLGIIRGWDSNWFGDKDYAEKVVEDEKIRRYLQVRIEKGGISRIVIFCCAISDLPAALVTIKVTVTTCVPVPGGILNT